MSGIRHTIQTQQRCRELREAGWTLRRISELLASEGFDPAPSPNSISLWCDDKARNRDLVKHRQRGAARRAAQSDFRFSAGPPRSMEWRFGRMRALADLGLSATAIAAVVGFDFPDSPLSGYQVRTALAEGEMPAAWRRKAMAA